MRPTITDDTALQALLLDLTEKINQGLRLEEILDIIFDSFRIIIPYHRIGLALVSPDGASLETIWGKTDNAVINLPVGYSAPLQGSSLATLLESGQPRILNNLSAYLKDHPHSDSTRRIVKEGIQSSLTCPLISRGKPLGVLFFSSRNVGEYQGAHVEIYLQISGLLSTILEKSALYEEVLRLSQEKNNLLGMVAHDLRGPISIIQGYTELLKENIIEAEKEKDHLHGRIINACKTMLALINNSLSLAALESGRLTLKPEQIDLHQFVNDLIEDHRILASAKSIQLSTHIPSKLPSLTLDPHRLGEILSNLITNALKFSFPNTKTTLSVDTKETSVIFSVMDQGQGIPAEALPTLFSSNNRPGVLPTGGEKTTGLGLAIVKKLTEAMGGQIHVESQVGYGTIFQIAFPLGG